MQNIPLSLYIHIPWCVRKCPYCDFNSHTLKTPPDETTYINHLLRDLEYDYDGRPIETLFIGGGTPSLFSGQSITMLMNGIRERTNLSPNAEITLEANPGTSEQAKFIAYREAGINRLSIGIQSFDPAQLTALGRIHTAHEAQSAVDAAQQAGFDRINTDLMFALPKQTVEQALHDLETAIALNAEHLSWYQLTLEPNTAFYTNPPPIPDEDGKQDIYEAGCALLTAHGFQQYETSAWTRGEPSHHNLNYWQFGDYIGIGAGAHGKLTLADGTITRNRKYRSPTAYQAAKSTTNNPYQDAIETVSPTDIPFEFMMNALRLKNGVPREYLTQRTSLTHADIAATVEPLIAKKLLRNDPHRYQTTELGFAFLNNVISAFLPE